MSAADSFSPRTTETRLTLPLNGTIYTTTRQIPSEKPTVAVGETMAAELGAAWSDSLVIAVSVVPQSGKRIQTVIHSRIPSEADQLASNWEYSTADIGGKKYPSVMRTVILLASAVSETSPAAGSAMPVVTAGLFSGSGYILVDRDVMRAGMQLEPVFKVEKRNYVKRTAITALMVDPLNGKTLTTSSSLYYATEVVSGGLTMTQLAAAPTNAFWGVQADGTQRTFDQLSAAWWAVETKQLVGGTMVDGVIDVGSFSTNENYEWPAVLESITQFVWPRREGGEDKDMNITYRPERFHGPCRCTTDRTWSKDAFTIPVVVQMQPKRITYGSPFFNLNIPECLHASYTCDANVGTTDQTWKSTAGTAKTFQGTNFTTWPAYIVAFDDQEPFRGGYLRTKRTIYAPPVEASLATGTFAAIGTGQSTIIYTLAGATTAATVQHVIGASTSSAIVISVVGTAITITFGKVNGTVAATLAVTPSGDDNHMTLTAASNGLPGNLLTYEQVAGTGALTSISAAVVGSDIKVTTGGTKTRMIVSGITGDRAHDNGEYFYTGTEHGYPFYTKTGTYGESFGMSYPAIWIYDAGGVDYWFLGDAVNDNFYCLRGTTNYPDEVDIATWQHSDAGVTHPTIMAMASSQAQVIAKMNATTAVYALVHAAASGTVTGLAGTFTKTNLAGGNGTYPTAAQIITAVNADSVANLLVVASLGDGSGTVGAMSPVSLATH
ncbi:MAG: hypothetical protein WCO57_04685 [Verrucomicrobiota bacterium]